MLEVLRIQNYALIDDLEVVFGPGFNVLTGETGAGKSIVVGALNLVLGARASGEAVRQGASQAKVDAMFRLDRPIPRIQRILKDKDIPIEDGELLVSRVVTHEGRSRAYVNGNLVPIAVLAEVGDELVDLHGQHEHQSLLKADRQLDLLDAFANVEALAADVADLVSQMREVEAEIERLQVHDRERTRRVEFLRYEVGEIEAAALEPGEEEELKSRRNLISNSERVFQLAGAVQSHLYDDEDKAAVMAIDGAAAALEELAALDGRFGVLAGQLSEVRAAVESVVDEVRKYSENNEFDPDQLERINARLALIGDLKRKFGASIDDILAYREKAIEEIARYDNRDRQLEECRARRAVILEEANNKALSLSKKRHNAAKTLDKEVTQTLQGLGMKGGAFVTAIETVSLGTSGIDHVTFMLSANPGEKPKPLKAVASGGETSRIMLALKAVFAAADKIPTLIFDEIDAGVGGHIARDVGEKMSQLALSHQVISITHIAQIAAQAAGHFHVAKSAQAKRITTTVTRIDGEARVPELARLLDGSVSEISLGHARALLTELGKGRK